MKLLMPKSLKLPFRHGFPVWLLVILDGFEILGFLIEFKYVD